MIENEPPMDENLTPPGGAPTPENPDAAANMEHNRQAHQNGPDQQRQPEQPPPELENLFVVEHQFRVPEAGEAMALLQDPQFLEECIKDTPELNGAALRHIRDFLDNKVDTTEREHALLIRAFFVDLQKMLDKKAAESGNPARAKENALKVERALFEEAIENLIGVADDSPEVEFQKKFQPTFQQSEYIASMKNLAKIFDDPTHDPKHPHEFSTYISELILVRQEAHNLRLSIKYGKQYQEEVLRLGLQSFQFLQDDIVGLPEVVRLFERAAASQVAKAKTWFSAEDERAVQEEAAAAFYRLAGIDKDGKPVRGPNGQQLPPLVTKDGRRLTDWEVKRAIRMGENMFYSTQRMAMYSGMGNLPSIASIAERIGSVPGGEYQVRYLYAAKIAARFAAGDNTAEHFWDRIYRELVGGKYEAKRDLHGWLTGEVHDAPETNPRETGIFGLQKRTLLINTLGAVDVESQSWRTLKMFISSVRFVNGESLHQRILRTAEGLLNDPHFGFDSTAEKTLSEQRDPVLGGGNLTGKGKEQLAKVLEKELLGQRLYLSVLAKNGNLSDAMKQSIWEKISILNPSTIASMWPESIRGNAAWESLQAKLWIAEEARVKRDAEPYKRGLTEAQLQQEADAFKQMKEIAKKPAWTDGEFRTVLSYMHMEDILGNGSMHALTSAERGLLQKIISTGIAKAKDTAGSTMAHTYCITDTPMISWAITEDGKAGVATEDLIRLYTGDQVNFGEGWGAVGGFVGDPVKGDFVKSMQTGVQKIGSVIGTGGAQGLVEPFVTAWLKFASDRHPYTSGMRNFFRQPNSEFSQYNRGTFYSMSDHERHLAVDALVQAGVLSDDRATAQAAGVMTMADRVRKRVSADLYARLLATLRMMSLIFGAEFVNAMIKVALPEEATKGLGIK